MWEGRPQNLVGPKKIETEVASIGAYSAQDMRYLFADIDEVAVWDRVLASVEVATIQGSGRAINLAQVMPDDLIAWYRFNQQFGDSTSLITNQIGTANTNGSTVNNVVLEVDNTVPVPLGSPDLDQLPPISGTSYDNAFVQHGVPNTDKGYSWITASLRPESFFYGFDALESPPTGAANIYKLARSITTGPSGSSGSYLTASYPFGNGPLRCQLIMSRRIPL